MNHLILNQIQTPDGTVLISRHRHDYRTYTDKNGEKYMVDGGLEYLRRNICKEPHIEQSVYDDDGYNIVRSTMVWGTRGKEGTSSLKYKPIKDLSIPHIQAILDTQFQIGGWLRDIFIKELEYRKEK